MPQNIPVNAMPEDLKGVYSNMVSVTAQEREVVIDFLSNVKINDQTSAALVSRIFLNHFTAKELCGLIQHVLQNWEKIRYEIPPVDPEKK